MSIVTIFAGIIKIATIFVKIIFKDSKKVERVTNYISIIKSISAFFDTAKFDDFQ